MKGYGQFCPIAVACETFAERWTPLILRELLGGARRFNEIRQGIPLISRTLLAQRLRELEDAGVVTSRPLARGRGREYRPTRAGEEFHEVLDRLGAWGQRWATTQFDPENVDLMLLMWNMHRRIDTQRLPARRTVIRFEFRAFPARCRSLRTCWLILEREGTDVCVKDAGRAIGWVDRRGPARAGARVPGLAPAQPFRPRGATRPRQLSPRRRP
jgi:DNA-binding HxlR family transcriptional regulator